MSQILEQLTKAGVSIWLDDLDRNRIISGELARMITTDSIRGVTTNPSIFHNAIANSSDSYATALKELASAGLDAEAAVKIMTSDDVRNACDVFADVFKETHHVDGRVSIEVDPRLARKTQETIAQAQQLWDLVDRENLYIKIPATTEGLAAITEVIGRGISVNVTLIFSVERYREVMIAYQSGLELAIQRGHDISKIQSVASFFVSRVDTEVDARLEKIGTDAALALRGQAAIANARLAWQAYLDHLASQRWMSLANANKQRPLWASTGVKNPRYSDTRYVLDLVAPGCVNTMPEATLRAVVDHGDFLGDTVSGESNAAANIWAELAAVGVDTREVFQVLEDEGVQKFEQAWTELLETVSTQLTDFRQN